ncbi:MAG: metallophosphoesterase [Acidobacteriota bacterium]
MRPRRPILPRAEDASTGLGLRSRAWCRTAIAVLLLACSGPQAFAQQVESLPGSSRRIVAIGDIHGAFNGVREILRKIEIIDQRDNWVGGNSVLVQTGDFLDRGPGATKVAELLMRLQEEAPKQGGQVIVLLGNHEILNLLSDFRDVTKYIYRNFIDGHSEKRLTVSCNGYASFYRRIYELRRDKPPKRRELVERCRTEHQLGQVEYLEAMGPTGDIGRWLRTLPIAAEVDGIVFVHGGFSPEMAERDLESLNKELRREIKSFDATRRYLIDQNLLLPTSPLADVLSVARQLAKATSNAPTLPPLSSEFLHVLQFSKWLAVLEDGPLWFRGYARWSEEEGDEQLPLILERLNADRVVVGHTPQPPFHIRTRFDSRVFLIDTGMLTSFYKGHPSALEIQDGIFTAFYLTRQTLLYEPRTVAMTQ